MIGNWLASIIKDPVTLLFLLTIVVSKQPTLSLLSLVVLPACLLPIIIYGRKVRKSARAVQTHAAELANLMHESFTGNRIIKAYSLEDMVLAQFRETTRKYIGQMLRVIRSYEIPSQTTEFLGALGVALVLIYLALFTDHSQVSADPGGFFAFVGSIFLMYPPIKNLTRLHNQLQQARSANQRVFELLDTVSTITDPPRPLPLHASQADLHFDNLDFDYGDKPVLRGINLTVKAGQLVALVGSSGSGKTTLTNLLLRFYDPQRGAVCIGTTDIRQVAINDLRGQIALVTQETILFNDTIRRNIAFGRPGATDTEIEAAAHHAGLSAAAVAPSTARYDASCSRALTQSASHPSAVFSFGIDAPSAWVAVWKARDNTVPIGDRSQVASQPGAQRPGATRPEAVVQQTRAFYSARGFQYQGEPAPFEWVFVAPDRLVSVTLMGVTLINQSGGTSTRRICKLIRAVCVSGLPTGTLAVVWKTRARTLLAANGASPAGARPALPPTDMAGKFGGLSSMRASTRRVFSPPDSARIFLSRAPVKITKKSAAPATPRNTSAVRTSSSAAARCETWSIKRRSTCGPPAWKAMLPSSREAISPTRRHCGLRYWISSSKCDLFIHPHKRKEKSGE